jgi:hypothetical protein
MQETILSALQTINQIVTAGNAITAFSLLLYSLTFNLQERVARAFALLMGCVTIVYFGDVLASTAQSDNELALWLKLQWLGIAFVPATFVHFSDALLAATGRPSRGRRKAVVVVSYLAGVATLIIVSQTSLIVGGLDRRASAGFLKPGFLFPVFTLFLLLILAFSAFNFWRTYQRGLTRTSKRRMRYLFIGSIGPIFATFPFMMVGNRVAEITPLLFWGVLVLSTVFVAGMLVMMAYSVAYSGVSYPDRVIKSRLFQWLLRGPVVASTVLTITIIVNRAAIRFDMENSRLIPFAMVATLLLLQYLITFVRQPIERWLFYGRDRADVVRLQVLEDRLLTTGDLKQFLESVLNAICDITGSQSAFVAVFGEGGLELEVAVGPDDPLRGSEDLPPILMADQKREIPDLGTLFIWDGYWLLPLRGSDQTEEISGLIGIRARASEPDYDPAEALALSSLASQATMALTDRQLQHEVFDVVDRLVPHIEEVQRMRAAARYIGSDAFSEPVEGLNQDANLVKFVRAALSHYWGGPRLTESPLLQLRIVRQTLGEHDGNPVNSLRAILRRGIERVKPEGERRFTAEWMLYNILEMKFLQGRKVRDVAMRLAMSEADLYRKQRVAIEAVTAAITEMEREASQDQSSEQEAT